MKVISFAYRALSMSVYSVQSHFFLQTKIFGTKIPYRVQDTGPDTFRYFILQSNISIAAVSITASAFWKSPPVCLPTSTATSQPKYSFSSLPVLNCLNYFAIYYYQQFSKTLSTTICMKDAIQNKRLLYYLQCVTQGI